jgi:protein-tyrosine phosphatase
VGVRGAEWNDDGSDFHVLFVCTANHCRSPIAEHLLRSELETRELRWSIESAGTQAHPGVPMHPSADRVLYRRGIDVGDWVSQSLTPKLIDGADLILTAEESHRGPVARLSPAAVGRTFTLLQFAMLTRLSPPPALAPGDYGPALLRNATQNHGRLQPVSPTKRDLADPAGQSIFSFGRCATTIERALEDILVSCPSSLWRLPV